jgi:hypothetical protein
VDAQVHFPLRAAEVAAVVELLDGVSFLVRWGFACY